MAQYLVGFGGKYFANRSLIKSLYKVGDSGLTLLLAKDAVSVREMLGRAVYQVPPEVAEEARSRKGVRFQDIDEQVSRYTTKGCEDLPKHVVSCEDVFCLSGFRYVQLRDIAEEATRYRTIRDMPYIEFLGHKYVVLDAREKGKACKVAVLSEEQ